MGRLRRTYCGNSLGDGDRECDADNLTDEVQPDFAPSHLQERLGWLYEAALTEEEDDLLCHAVRLDRTPLDWQRVRLKY